LERYEFNLCKGNRFYTDSDDNKSTIYDRDTFIEFIEDKILVQYNKGKIDKYAIIENFTNLDDMYQDLKLKVVGNPQLEIRLQLFNRNSRVKCRQQLKVIFKTLFSKSSCVDNRFRDNDLDNSSRYKNKVGFKKNKYFLESWYQKNIMFDKIEIKDEGQLVSFTINFSIEPVYLKFNFDDKEFCMSKLNAFIERFYSCEKAIPLYTWDNSLKGHLQVSKGEQLSFTDIDNNKLLVDSFKYSKQSYSSKI
jgi:hypothetical protein